MIVDDLANEQYAAFLIEHRSADTDLGRRIADLGFEQGLDPRMIGAGVRCHDARTQPPERLVTFDIVRIFGERETGLRGRHQLARPGQPVGVVGSVGRPLGLVSGLRAQTVGSVTRAVSVVVPPGPSPLRPSPLGPSISASVNVRQVPEISTSEGRKRALYAILRLSGTQ